MAIDRESQDEAVAEQETNHLTWVLGGAIALLPALLFAAHPILALFEQNQSELALSVLWSPLAVTFAAAALLYGVLMLSFRSWTKAGALTALAVVAFFYFDTFKGDISGLNLSGGWALVLWLALCAAVAVIVARTRRGLGTLLLGLGIAAAVLAIAPAANIASYQHRHPALNVSDPRLWAGDPLPPPKPVANRPDIYVIIPDDYARADVLRRYLHYDNRAFASALERRGFTISPQARSPYSDSESNITAELNMGYLDGLGRVLGGKSQDVRPLKNMMEDNRAARLAKAAGYRWVHLDSDEVTFAGGNPDISPVATPDSFTSLWLEKSVLREVGGRFGFNGGATDERFRKSIRSSFSRLTSVPTQRSPKFVVFHTLVPHDPYIFGARGQSVTFPSTKDEVIHSHVALPYYLQQVKFVERELLDTIDKIRARSEQPPVIVVMTDEGLEAGDKTFGEAAMRQIRVKGLVALSIPGTRGKPGPNPPNTVNVLRHVFNKVLGTKYPMLRSASYPEGDYPYQWEEMRVR
jgi:hypothetical protein